ncbi:YdcH family protein [Magnetococcales bacterium HHB-1]
MFEDQLAAVQELLKTNDEFKALYERHQQLKTLISETNITAINQLEVERMKKEKLHLKDKMAIILDGYSVPA